MNTLAILILSVIFGVFFGIGAYRGGPQMLLPLWAVGITFLGVIGLTETPLINAVLCDIIFFSMIGLMYKRDQG